MQKGFELLLVLAALLISGFPSHAQSQTTAQERAERLREQLAEVLDQLQESEKRLLQLEEELKPENIEKSLAGIGSTHPEALRELRRRQLELEKVRVKSQLKQLAETRTQLDSAIVNADAGAYHQSANENLERRQQSGSEPQVKDKQKVGRSRRTTQSRSRGRRPRQ
jgi:hypothetical protein